MIASHGVPRGAADIRDRAGRLSPDPFPMDPVGAAAPSSVWHALPGQWQLGVLHRLVREGFAGACDVEFAANYGALESRVRFRGSTTAHGALWLATTSGEQTVAVSADGGWETVVDAPEGTPAGVAAVGAEVSDVEARTDVGGWVRADAACGDRPDIARNPVVPVEMHLDGELYRAPAELFGRVLVFCDEMPIIFAGESREEAIASARVEQRHDMRERGPGVWESVHELGMRFLRIVGDASPRVVVEARVHPLAHPGAFACSDDALTAIWTTSAYTLRVCSQGMLIDGVKRDRMPWMGDTALGARAVAHAFSDGSLIEDGLVALGQPRTGYVNGIVDYSLWWLIATADYLTYFDAAAYVSRHAEHLHGFVERLAAEADERGVLRPHPGDDAYAKPIFIDWQVTVDPERDCTALQMLWYWALRSAARVLAAAGHPGELIWNALADRLRGTLRDEAWSADTGTWREYLGGTETDSPYPNLFAVLAGIAPELVGPEIAELLRDGPRVRTPFVAAFALDALARAGDPEAAVRRIRARWGEMLDADATTFWEEFPESDAGPYEMYGRPFGKSLCHAWAAGPAQLLPEIVCGVRPLDDGWASFEVSPALGDLDWAACVTPVPGGEIVVIATPSGTTVDVPAGHTLVHAGRRHSGPGRVTL